jgi:hypothetical protein
MRKSGFDSGLGQGVWPLSGVVAGLVKVLPEVLGPFWHDVSAAMGRRCENRRIGWQQGAEHCFGLSHGGWSGGPRARSQRRKVMALAQQGHGTTRFGGGT